MIQRAKLSEAIPHLSHRQILVIGDVILDEYLMGQANRLSREAPIPVLEYQSRQTIPGGATNPAMNIVALGSSAAQIGLIGDDAAGQELVTCLEATQIDASGLVVDATRPTTQKTRLVAQGSLRFPQQIARLDRLDRQPPSSNVEAKLIQQLEIKAPMADALLISDYGNGLLTPNIVEATRRLSHNHNKRLIVDSQGHLDKYQGFDIIRANDRDTAAYLKQPLTSEADFQRATTTLLQTLQAQGLIIGRGDQGVSFQGKQTPYTHLPATNPREVFDVTGAGDTVIAVLTLGLIATLNLAEAVCLANYAAGLVIQKLGNATPSPQELRSALRLGRLDTT